MQLTRLVAALGLLAATSAFSLAPARPARALLSPAASAAVQPSMFFGAKAAAPKARLLRCTNACHPAFTLHPPSASEAAEEAGEAGQEGREEGSHCPPSLRRSGCTVATTSFPQLAA